MKQIRFRENGAANACCYFGNGKKEQVGSSRDSNTTAEGYMAKKNKDVYQRRRDPVFWGGGKIVPTVEEMEDIIIPLHYEKGHSVDIRVMRDALTAKGYGLPSFLGGWRELANCKLSVKMIEIINHLTSQLFRVLHDCPQCFWRLHQGNQWQRAVSVPYERRKEICRRLGVNFRKETDTYFGEWAMWVSEPPFATCKARYAQGAGA